MKQNVYDDPTFFDGYGSLPRSRSGLAEANEWPTFAGMLPPLAGLGVLDLGCGYGWHCRYLREHGARSVLGIDLSEKMLAEARRRTNDPAIEYRRAAIEDLDAAAGSFDLVISSLALHYVADYPAACRKVATMLRAGGTFAFSTEHPMLTARAEQDWFSDPDGRRLHWPVDEYHETGARTVRWLGAEVVKYHRTIEVLFDGLVRAGLQVDRIAEPSPSPDEIARRPAWRDERRRPLFLLMRATKPA